MSKFCGATFGVFRDDACCMLPEGHPGEHSCDPPQPTEVVLGTAKVLSKANYKGDELLYIDFDGVFREQRIYLPVGQLHEGDRVEIVARLK